MNDRVPRLILPGEFPDPSGVVRLNQGFLRPTEREAEIVQAILGPGGVVAMTSPPSFFDQVHIYATHQQLYEFMVEPELAQFLDLAEVTLDRVIEMLNGIPFEPAMAHVASMQKAISFGRTDKDWQRKLMRELYLHTPISRAGERFLRSNDRAAIFSEQQLFALQRLLVLHASDEPAESLTPEQDIALRLALFYTPGTVLTHEAELVDAPPETVEDERWLQFFVGNGGFADNGWLKHDMARLHTMYEVIANSAHVKKRDAVNFCPLADWIQQEYRMSFTELQAFGFILYVGSQINLQDSRPLAVTPGYFSNTAFADRVDDGFRAFAATRDWYRHEFEGSAENPRRAAFETAPFLRRPGLRFTNGNVLITSPRAIDSWLGSTGAYYRLLDIARDKGSATRKKFTRFNGTLQEIYVRRLAHVAYPYPEGRRRSLAVGMVYGEQEYKKRKQTLKTSDVIIDLGLDLVLLEVTAKRLTEKSLVEADADAVRDDLQMMLVDKMKQLGRVIGDIYDDPTRLPQVDLSLVQRIWPIVVSADGVFHNPTVWDYTDKHAGHYLRFEREQVNATVKPVVMLDLAEVEILFGLVTSGISLIDVLENKTLPTWLDRDFKAMVSEWYDHRWNGEADFVAQEQRRAMRKIRRAIDLRPGQDAEAEAERQAA